MFSTLRTRFGIPGVISVIALVFAMLGGAYAANDSSGGGKATASAKAKKGPRGPKGPKGDTGPQGPAGANGKDGANGSNGANGADGVSVTSEQFTGTKENKCAGAGGSRFVSASGITFACNGKAGEEGPQGADGEPWTVGNTLPPNATETGAWVLPKLTESAVPPFAADTYNLPLSFPVKLAAELDAAHVHVISVAGLEYVFEEGEGKEVPSASCHGSAADPTADPGHLCVYVGELTTGTFPGSEIGPEVPAIKFVQPIRKLANIEPGASTAGAQLRLHVKAESAGMGTFAVTAPASS